MTVRRPLPARNSRRPSHSSWLALGACGVAVRPVNNQRALRQPAYANTEAANDQMSILRVARLQCIILALPITKNLTAGVERAGSLSCARHKADCPYPVQSHR